MTCDVHHGDILTQEILPESYFIFLFCLQVFKSAFLALLTMHTLVWSAHVFLLLKQ